MNGFAVQRMVIPGPDGKSATLDPNSDLLAKGTYTATVTTGVKDEVGNALASEKTWSFLVK